MSDKEPKVTSNSDGFDRDDEAVRYLEGHGNVNPNVDLGALRRKIDRRLMPYMFCCYILQFLDKVMLNVSCQILRRPPPPFISTGTWTHFVGDGTILSQSVDLVCGRYGNQDRSEARGK